ncbi:MAG: dodecin protein [Dehalococcoidia bacterium]|nr:dodecin protein [Dehalococcoidia bacterium]MBF8304554.1 dodecin protein [Dehalococcoidia bacterium]
MKESVYKFVELVGTHPESWEKAAASAVRLAAQKYSDLRIAEVSELDLQIYGGAIVNYRAKVKISYKWEENDAEKKPGE